MKSKKHKAASSTGKNVSKTNRATNFSSKQKAEKKQVAKKLTRLSVSNEPNATYSIISRIRSIGNSKGVILPNRVIEESGISPDADLIIQVSDGTILIAEAKSSSGVNTNLSSWEKQFKNAIKKGNKPETDVWNGVQNRFDEEEWK